MAEIKYDEEWERGFDENFEKNVLYQNAGSPNESRLLKISLLMIELAEGTFANSPLISESGKAVIKRKIAEHKKKINERLNKLQN